METHSHLSVSGVPFLFICTFEQTVGWCVAAKLIILGKAVS